MADNKDKDAKHADTKGCAPDASDANPATDAKREAKLSKFLATLGEVTRVRKRQMMGDLPFSQRYRMTVATSPPTPEPIQPNGPLPGAFGVNMAATMVGAPDTIVALSYDRASSSLVLAQPSGKPPLTLAFGGVVTGARAAVDGPAVAIRPGIVIDVEAGRADIVLPASSEKLTAPEDGPSALFFFGTSGKRAPRQAERDRLDRRCFARSRGMLDAMGQHD